MDIRCAKFWLRGTASLRPIPGHADLRCWMAGQTASGIAVLVAIPAIIFAAGFSAGRIF